MDLKIAEDRTVALAAQEETDKQDGNILQGMRFLCAEDNELNAEILTELLKIEGAECTICENGEEILKAFEQSAPGDYDMILMDVQMPVMNGYEATRAIRRSSHELAKTIPIIAMTANAFSEDIQHSLTAGMNAHVSKPVEMICQGEVEPNKIGKTVLVIDEAQDMGAEEHALVKALIANYEEMRVIAVGDDDQNIYEFRGSDSGYMYRLAQESGSTFVEMTENYRSARQPVDFANGFLKNIHKRIKSTPIISMRKEKGWVEVIRYQSEYMYQPLVENLLQHRDKGTSCVLTQTNEEAVILMALLRKHGINSKLIQSMDGLRFWNMAEMRYFLRYINKRIKTPLITEELWEEAKHNTFSTYDRSLSLMYVKRCVEQFEQTNKTKYFSDFKEFVFESSVEDFCDVSGADVVVSTIHKAKGREFDDVYMLISDNYVKDAHLMRRYYVGITRAKNRLFIHTNSDCFNHLSADRYLMDQRQYDMPEEIVLQLSHKDVNLGFFKERKQEVLALRGGDSLIYNDFFLYSSSTDKPIAKLSSRMQGTLSEWEQRGYKVQSASVRFVVAWKPKDAPKDETETAVLLADLRLSL